MSLGTPTLPSTGLELPRNQPLAGRAVALGAGTLAVGSGGYAFARWLQARSLADEMYALSDPNEAGRIYDEQVVPGIWTARLAGVSAVLLAGTTAWLWQRGGPTRASGTEAAMATSPMESASPEASPVPVDETAATTDAAAATSTATVTDTATDIVAAPRLETPHALSPPPSVDESLDCRSELRKNLVLRGWTPASEAGGSGHRMKAPGADFPEILDSMRGYRGDFNDHYRLEACGTIDVAGPFRLILEGGGAERRVLAVGMAKVRPRDDRRDAPHLTLAGESAGWNLEGTMAWRQLHDPAGTRQAYLAWFADGQPQHEGEFKGGKRHGHWTTFHANGVPASRGIYVDGNRVGEWTGWHENGQIANKVTWVVWEHHPQNITDGLYEGWHENGKLSRRFTWDHGVKVGETRTWHRSGVLAELGSYTSERVNGDRDCKVGPWRRFAGNGDLVGQTTYRCLSRGEAVEVGGRTFVASSPGEVEHGLSFRVELSGAVYAELLEHGSRRLSAKLANGVLSQLEQCQPTRRNDANPTLPSAIRCTEDPPASELVAWATALEGEEHKKLDSLAAALRGEAAALRDREERQAAAWSGAARERGGGPSVALDEVVDALLRCHVDPEGATRDCLSHLETDWSGATVQWVGLIGSGDDRGMKSFGRHIVFHGQSRLASSYLDGRIRQGTVMSWPFSVVLPTGSEALAEYAAGRTRLGGRTEVKGRFMGFVPSSGCPVSDAQGFCFVPSVQVTERDGLVRP